MGSYAKNAIREQKATKLVSTPLGQLILNGDGVCRPRDRHPQIAFKILAKYARVDDPAILAEVYRNYAERHLAMIINIDIHEAEGALKGLRYKVAEPTPST